MLDAVNPAWMIKQWLESHQKSQKEMAAAMGYKEPFISKLVNGHVHVSIKVALKLERFTTVAAATWLGYETNYRLALARRALA